MRCFSGCFWIPGRVGVDHFCHSRRVCPLIPLPVKCGLHVFTGASEKGFGGAVYLGAESESGLDVSFFIAKARVAPNKFLTIPRSELSEFLGFAMDSFS